MSRSILYLLLAVSALAAADPYDVWSQGRPAEAVRPLIASAQESGRWDAWLDAGLAAAAAGDRGMAISCLTSAHNRAPEQAAPREALRALGTPLPTTWCERAGPVAQPGLGWNGVVLLAVAGLALGGAAALRRGRGVVLLLGGVALLAALPGVAATWIDGRRIWLATVRDSAALDSTGTPLRALPAGSLLEQVGEDVWAGRLLVRLADGSLTYVAQADITP
jgi:hypothetical protein